MRFYTRQHRHYCGIDLHARSMYLCILDQEGNVLLHQKLRCDRERFLETIAPYRDGLVVGAECIFSWYWLADLCAEHGIPFVLGHALYKGLFCFFVFLGPLISLGPILDISDALVFLICVPNIFGLYLLAPVARREMERFFALSDGESGSAGEA